jgi:hypothetical protein
MAEGARPTLDLASLSRGGRYSTFLWGDSRAVMKRVLYGMVRANDPEPLWLELRGRGASEEEPGPVELGWIRHDHLFLADEPTSAHPQDAIANMALWTVVRSDEPDTAVARLADFVRLPPIAQQVLQHLDLVGGPHALAVANSDRVRGEYPTTVEGVRPIVRALMEGPLLPFFGSVGPPGAGRMAFDFVFEFRASGTADWGDGTLVAEKVPDGHSLPVGRSIRLRDIPGLSGAFASTPGPK